MEVGSTQTSTWLLTATSETDVEKHQKKKEEHKHGKRKTKPWSRLRPVQKVKKVFGVFFRILFLSGILYLFICSLGLLEDAFKLLGGRAAGETFRNSDLLSNPIAGLMIGVLATVLVQSSSTATSIVVAMVASEVIPLRSAIPIIMGTNVGTSITSTLVSLGQAGERTEFRRAFAGATVHDMFNWSAVILLLPLEVATGYLYYLTKAIVDFMEIRSENHKLKMLTALTEPFTHLIVEINRDVITDIALAPNISMQSTVLKRWCKVTMLQKTISVMRYDPVEVDCDNVDRESPFYASCTYRSLKGSAGGFFVGWNDSEVVTSTLERTKCSNMFAFTDLNDRAAGTILLIVSIATILCSLFAIVKVLHSMLQGPVAKVIHKTVNADFPGRLGFLTGYVALLVGCGMTIIIQSSSVFTSTLTPLVGVGIVSVERMYPMTLGSNIGTTVTGILAAMSIKGKQIDQAMQIALCHLFFNISSVLIFYPIPFMRIPIPMAKVLGRVTSNYRWFAGVYLFGMFLILPAIVFSLSIAGWIYLTVVGVPIFALFMVVTLINFLQVKRPQWLPRLLRSWDFLPLACHSWAFYDRLITCRCLTELCPRSDSSDDDYEDSDETGSQETPDHNGYQLPEMTVFVKKHSLDMS